MKSMRVRAGASVAVICAAGLLAPSASSSAEQRLLSTPAERLVGHWAIEDGSQHYYFSRIDANGRGRYFVVFPALMGERSQGAYKFISQDQKADRVTIQLIEDDPNGARLTCVVSKDGSTMVVNWKSSLWTDVMKLKYVDDKVAPGSGGADMHRPVPDCP